MYVNYRISLTPLVLQKFVGCMDGQSVFYQKQEKYVLNFLLLILSLYYYSILHYSYGCLYMYSFLPLLICTITDIAFPNVCNFFPKRISIYALFLFVLWIGNGFLELSFTSILHTNMCILSLFTCIALYCCTFVFGNKLQYCEDTAINCNAHIDLGVD